jgi:hypothetical protein
MRTRRASQDGRLNDRNLPDLLTGGTSPFAPGFESPWAGLREGDRLPPNRGPAGRNFPNQIRYMPAEIDFHERAPCSDANSR